MLIFGGESGHSGQIQKRPRRLLAGYKNMQIWSETAAAQPMASTVGNCFPAISENDDDASAAVFEVHTTTFLRGWALFFLMRGLWIFHVAFFVFGLLMILQWPGGVEMVN